mgnify:CR=1 FL=1
MTNSFNIDRSVRRFGRGAIQIVAPKGEFLSFDRIAASAPTVFANDRHESRSERFQVIPTHQLLQGLQKEGFVPVKVQVGGSSDVNKRAFTKHLIRFRRIDDLAATARPCFDDRGQHTEREECTTAGEVAEQIQRCDRATRRRTDRSEYTGQRDVVEIVTRRGCQRALPTPTGHTTIGEPRVECVTVGGTEAESLHHTGTKTFDERIAARDELPRDVECCVFFEVECDAAATAAEHPMPRVEAPCVVTIDADDVGAEIGEQHAGVRGRTDTGELNHANGGERAVGRRRTRIHAP